MPQFQCVSIPSVSIQSKSMQIQTGQYGCANVSAIFPLIEYSHLNSSEFSIVCVWIIALAYTDIFKCWPYNKREARYNKYSVNSTCYSMNTTQFQCNVRLPVCCDDSIALKFCFCEAIQLCVEIPFSSFIDFNKSFHRYLPLDFYLVEICIN